jgi:hypothetical protein
MPLQTGKSAAAFEHNLKAELAANKPKDQALAIAYAQKRRADESCADGIGKALELLKSSIEPSPIDKALSIARQIAGECGARADADKWITVNSSGHEGAGTPALIGEDGTVKGGMGGKFTGKNIKDAHGTKKFTSGETNAETEARHAAEKTAAEQPPISQPEEAPKSPAQQASENANKLSETAKTAEEHTAARNAHVKAANLLGQGHKDWEWHYDQHKVHEKAAKAAFRAEAKEQGGHVGKSREKEFSKSSPEEISQKLSDKFGVKFSNGANVQAAKKQKDAAWDEYIKTRSPEAHQKYDELSAAYRKAARTHNVRGLTTYDINDNSAGAKNARKTVAAVDAALDGMVSRGFDVKAAIGAANVSFVPGTCREYGGLAWGGERGHGYFTISHDKSINPEYVAGQKRAEKARTANGKPRWNAHYEGDDIADAVVRHELAHALGLQPHINSPQKLGKLLSEMHGGDKQASIEWIKSNISEYAAKNIHETDAELCALVTSPNYIKGTLPEQFEKHVYDLFKYKGN